MLGKFHSTGRAQLRGSSLTVLGQVGARSCFVPLGVPARAGGESRGLLGIRFDLGGLSATSATVAAQLAARFDQRGRVHPLGYCGVFHSVTVRSAWCVDRGAAQMSSRRGAFRARPTTDSSGRHRNSETYRYVLL